MKITNTFAKASRRQRVLNTKRSAYWRERIAPGLAIQVLGILLLLFALALVINTYFTIKSESHILHQQLDREGNNLAQASAIFATESLLIEDYPVLGTYTGNLVKRHPDLIYILIKRLDQKIVAKASRQPQNTSNTKRYFSNVLVDDNNIGSIEIGFSTENQDTVIANHLKRMIIQSLFVFLTLVVALFIFFRKMITDPIHSLVDQAKHLSTGNISDPIHLKASGELSQLSSALDNMRLRLKKSYDEITSQNRFLDQRVAERTRELSDANSKLIETHSQLLQSEKMAAVGQLSAGIAHEINNPIGFVSSNISILSDWFNTLVKVIQEYDDQVTNDKLKTTFDAIKTDNDFEYIKEEVPLLIKETQDGLARVSAIVSDLKNFAHADNMVWKNSDLCEGLNSTLNIVRNEVKYKADITFNANNIPLVECRPAQINQVFMNIIVNAAQAIADRGEITINMTHVDQWVRVSICDTGQGIPEKDLNRIMEPFYTTKPIGQGTGLGLSISYGIIKTHHGRIDIESKVGEGSTFHIWLPLKQPKEGSTQM